MIKKEALERISTIMANLSIIDNILMVTEIDGYEMVNYDLKKIEKSVKDLADVLRQIRREKFI